MNENGTRTTVRALLGAVALAAATTGCATQTRLADTGTCGGVVVEQYGHPSKGYSTAQRVPCPSAAETAVAAN